MIKLMVRELIITLMAQSTKETGLMTCSMEKGKRNGQMELYSKETTNWGRKRASEDLIGQMDRNI